MDDDVDFAAVVGELLDGWDAWVTDVELTTRGTGSRKGQDRTPAQFAVVMALVTHVHEIARLLRPYMAEGLTVVHIPLVRTMYEATLTAIWCDEVEDGAVAMMKEHGRQQRVLAKTMRETTSLGHIANSVQLIEWADAETPSAAQARSFEELVKNISLDGGYVYYRLLSGLSHATPTLIDAYLHDDGTLDIAPHPAPLESSFWGYLVANCLVWTGMVANYYEPGRRRRNGLRAIARRLETPRQLAVAYEAVLRAKKVRKSNSQELWIGVSRGLLITSEVLG